MRYVVNRCGRHVVKKFHPFVPAKAGAQTWDWNEGLDSRLRGNERAEMPLLSARPPDLGALPLPACGERVGVRGCPARILLCAPSLSLPVNGGGERTECAARERKGTEYGTK